MKIYDVVIIGAGAAGLMCAARASKRGKSVLILEANKTPGRKIIISGGGRCNFTNLEVDSSFYVSTNKHFTKSALAQYTNWDFISQVSEYGIEYHEKTLGQLFCNKTSKSILEMMVKEAGKNTMINCSTRVLDCIREEDHYLVETNNGNFYGKKLVLASGGLSMPKMGASDIGLKVAKKFGHKLIETFPALVPFTLDNDLLNDVVKISGVSLLASVQTGAKAFTENILFTHKGLSGPAILKASLYWQPHQEVVINLLPQITVEEVLKKSSKKTLANALKEYFPKSFIDIWVGQIPRVLDKKVAELSRQEIVDLREIIHEWKFIPSGTEGYRKAEVTRGGVCTSKVSSKTMESQLASGLFLIGEVLDVTGLLGGYNFQWAWSSGYVAGENV